MAKLRVPSPSLMPLPPPPPRPQMEQFGNPHSRTHLFGWESEAAVEAARQQVASLIGADAKEIVFTSGATEANNMAVKGIPHFYREKKRHVVTTQTEHKVRRAVHRGREHLASHPAK